MSGENKKSYYKVNGIIHNCNCRYESNDAKCVCELKEDNSLQAEPINEQQLSVKVEGKSLKERIDERLGDEKKTGGSRAHGRGKRSYGRGRGGTLFASLAGILPAAGLVAAAKATRKSTSRKKKTTTKKKPSRSKSVVRKKTIKKKKPSRSKSVVRKKTTKKKKPTRSKSVVRKKTTKKKKSTKKKGGDLLSHLLMPRGLNPTLATLGLVALAKSGNKKYPCKPNKKKMTKKKTKGKSVKRKSTRGKSVKRKSVTRKKTRGGGSAWRAVQYARGPSNTSDFNKPLFKSFNSDPTAYVSNSALRSGWANPQLAGLTNTRMCRNNKL